MSLTSLKLSFNGEIRRLSVAAEGLTYQDLMDKTLSVFPNLTSIQFSWVDDENDKVVISSSDELSEALRVMASENKGYLRFEVMASSDASPSTDQRETQTKLHDGVASGKEVPLPRAHPEVPVTFTNNPTSMFGTITHVGIECDACGTSPLAGSRFKCAVRDDYDLCESCEAKNPKQPYPMVKIYQPNQVPAGIMVVVGEGRRTKHNMMFGRCGTPNNLGATACHRGIVCDGCNIRNFHGPRFKCSVRNDFDLCESCEAKDSHAHVMVKIYPQHANMRIQVVPDFISGVTPDFTHDLQSIFGLLDRHQGPSHHHGRRHHGPHHRGPPGSGHRGPHDHRNAPGHGHGHGPRHHGPAHHGHHGSHQRNFGGCFAPNRDPVHHGCPSNDIPHRRGHGGWRHGHFSVAEQAANRAKHHAAVMEEQRRVHKSKEDTRLEDELLEMCIQESLAEKSRLATALAAASTSEDEAFVAERNRLRALALNKYAPSGMDITSNIIDSTTNEEKGESASTAKTSKTTTVLEDVSQRTEAPHPSAPPAPPTKLMCRFVRDVTMPDGSEVAPYSTFFKTWRVRNDGKSEWPEGCHLVSAGGDRMCDAKLGEDYVVRLPVPSTPAGEEVELTVELCAPNLSGRHVGYFRLQNPEGGYFGQRLWADIRVDDVDVSASMTLSPWQVVGSTSDDDDDEDVEDIELNTTSAKQEIHGDDVKEDVPEVEAEVSESVLTITETEREQLLEETALLEFNETSFEQIDAQEFDQDVILWSQELKVLSAMGFNDLNQLLPVLKANISVPASQQGEAGVGSESGLQTVVLALLSDQE